MSKKPDDWFHHLDALPRVLEVDLDYINKKDRSYGASWKQRGGVGAFMMLARKWDRLEQMMEEVKFDVFAAIAEQDGPEQGSDGTVIAEIRDLRRYLALVEAEMVARGAVPVSKDGTDYRPVRRLVIPDGTVVGPTGVKVMTRGGGGGPSRTLSSAQLEMKRDLSRRVPRYDEDPGTPGDGGHHAIPTEDGARDEHKMRRPRQLTHHEWTQIKGTPIEDGSMAGHLWEVLYDLPEDWEEGRPTMRAEHFEEYGR